mmetsp:Transcript_102231/g.164763  ORF Transcript_102231/g.164763 Transcript_102231/m.164763 type:complete len:94 (-) Transcript_102231:52-333(-)
MSKHPSQIFSGSSICLLARLKIGLNFKDLRLHTLINQRLVTPVLHRRQQERAKSSRYCAGVSVNPPNDVASTCENTNIHACVRVSMYVLCERV